MLGVSLLGQWYLERQIDLAEQDLEILGERIASELPRPLGSRIEIEADLREMIAESSLSAVHVLIRDPEGEILATASTRERRRPRNRSGGALFRGPRPTSAWMRIPLENGAQLELSAFGPPRPRGMAPLAAIAVFFGAIAIGAYPIARRLARGLEQLHSGVSDFGAGDLTVRIPVKGRNEVADVARAFNEAAEKIESLVATERRVLANASHEMRSPLARLRVAVELLAEGRMTHLGEAERSIEELDALVEDLLLAARLESRPQSFARESVDLLELAGEEAERVGATCQGETVRIMGNRRLLARLLRNLLDNAARYGAPPIEVRVETIADGSIVRLRVRDRGPGVPAGQRDRIFEAFYRPPGHAEGQDGGVGIGLALVAEIAREHGGTARAVEREGGGSCFEIEFPIGAGD
jgi:signal transduction histidine kinase